MAVHKLILENDFDEDVYSLIAIHCTIEDYRLAYLLNKCLDITLTRKVRGVGYQEETFLYSMFEWLDNKQMINWNLVSNIYRTEKNTTNKYISLFNSLDKITTVSYLIPQYKTVNYFLKIGAELNYSKQKKILNRILKIPQIATAYSIDINQLKSKDNLIFS